MTKLLGTCVVFLLFQMPILAQKKDTVNAFTDSIRNLPPLELLAIRVPENGPFAKTTISKQNLNKVNFGQDLPFLIQNTPSVIVNSDAGTGIGYTAMRIRGTDATRINVTLNGIPYNDAESMGTFFVDLPDFSSSVQSIQIQRGVGTSTNGAGAFGASLNLATNQYQPASYLKLQTTVGSFNSFKNSLQFGSGLLNKKFTIDGRISKINSDGYIDRAKSNLKSYYVSGTYWGDLSSLRINIFSGWEKTYQAWYGVPEALLASNRSYNPAGMEKADAPYSNQTDNYQQTHYQLFYNKTIHKNWKWNTAIFLTKGKGYYEEYKAGVNLTDYLPAIIPAGPIDIIRRKWLDNQFYGQIASLSYEHNKQSLIMGGGWNTYEGLHFGRLPYLNMLNYNPLTNYYFNNATKNDAHIYIKWNTQINTQLNSFIDLQYRAVQHSMYGFDHNPSLIIKRNFDFFNPKAGINFQSSKTKYYASIAIAHKEPNRDDFEAALAEQPKQEIVYDFETGFLNKLENFEWGMNFYYMYYTNQLVLTGKINEVGAYTRTNTPISYRLGLEMESQWKISPKWTNQNNISFSDNRIQKFMEYYDDYDNGGQISIPHKNTPIAFSPKLIASNLLSFQPSHKWLLFTQSKFVSKQFLDNTGNNARILKAYFTQDISAQYQLFKNKLGAAEMQLHVNNLFDTMYEPNGYTYSYLWGGAVTTSNNYYPMAGRNYWISFVWELK